MTHERIHKLISQSGLLSRRKAEAAILEGRVLLNGKVVKELGISANLEKDKLLLDGKQVLLPQQLLYFLMNKPRKVITSKRDPQGRKTVMHLLPKGTKVNPVGRLDYETEGLLLLTNDGELTHALTHPGFGVFKVYEAWVKGKVSDKKQEQLISSIKLTDGPGKFDGIRELESSKGNSLLEITVTEGRNRFVRRMMEAVGHPVKQLKRTRLGPLSLRGLEKGEVRKLTPDEIKQLRNYLN